MLLERVLFGWKFKFILSVRMSRTTHTSLDTSENFPTSMPRVGDTRRLLIRPDVFPCKAPAGQGPLLEHLQNPALLLWGSPLGIGSQVSAPFSERAALDLPWVSVLPIFVTVTLAALSLRASFSLSAKWRDCATQSSILFLIILIPTTVLEVGSAQAYWVFSVNEEMRTALRAWNASFHVILATAAAYY